MTLSARQILLLSGLCRGESIPLSALNKSLSAELLGEGLLTVRTRGSRRSLAAISGKSLKLYLQSHYEELKAISMDCDVEKQLKEMATSRSQQAALTGNSKLLGVARSCPGFPVNSYEPIVCQLNHRPLTIAPEEGTFTFITDWQHFVPLADVVVMGIENMDNFRLIRRQRPLFEKELPRKHLLFVSRYPQSADLREWLKRIPNAYIHFGDFDLAGIHIFQKEFEQYLGSRASFFIPSDIEQRLQTGTEERYNTQYPQFHAIQSNDPRISHLISLIHHYRRCYDQEGYVKLGV